MRRNQESAKYFKALDFCVHSKIAKFIVRQNITLTCSQEATAVVRW